jgi:hypothetical protein
MTEIKIEIGRYHEVNKGALKAFFNLMVYPHGPKITDCRYFVSGDNRWWNFPQKEIKKTPEGKPDYFPYVSYPDKQYLDQLKEAVLEALKDAKPMEYHAKKETKVHPSTCEKDAIQDDAPPLWF